MGSLTLAYIQPRWASGVRVNTSGAFVPALVQPKGAPKDVHVEQGNPWAAVVQMCSVCAALCFTGKARYCMKQGRVLYGAMCPLLLRQGLLERSLSNPGKVYFCCAMVNPRWELILFNAHVCARLTARELPCPEAQDELLLLEEKKEFFWRVS